MHIRMLREHDVRSLVDMADALTAVEGAFTEQGAGSGINEPRHRVRQPQGILHMMGGALTERGYWGFKAYTTTWEGARFVVNLYSATTGELLAIIEAGHLGQLRTGAASGVATKYLARDDASVLALFGSGYQAETQLTAIAAVRDLSDVRVYSRTPDNREGFARRMQDTIDANIEAVASVEAALDGADIVTTITTAREPLFDGSDLAAGTHINAAGSNGALRVELDTTTIQRADCIFVDDVTQSRIESGDLVQAYELNKLSWERVRPLADVVTGITAGRQSADEITLFESHGIALWDVALAAEIYERAEREDAGTMCTFGE